MDPRPFHFDYRKPRPFNPTYQSTNLYDSIYQMNGFTPKNPQSINRNINNYKERKSSQPDTMKRIQSVDMGNIKKITSNNQMSRYSSKQQLPVDKVDKGLKINSKLSNYGYNLMRGTSMDQGQIFQRQQQSFDIINYHPNQYRARLKAYPKLTLEDKLLQRTGSPLKN